MILLHGELRDSVRVAEGSPGLLESAWSPIYWEKEEKYMSFWNELIKSGKMSQIFKSILDESSSSFASKSEKAAVDANKVGVIHFRYSDVPINYGEAYPLALPEYSTFLGVSFREWGINRIIPTMCTNHSVDAVHDNRDRKKECTMSFICSSILLSEKCPQIHASTILSAFHKKRLSC